MFKRSLLSLALVASLVSPAAQAATWTESVQDNWSAFSGAVLTPASDFTCAVFSPSNYAGVVKAARDAYSNHGFKAAGSELVKNKSAIVGVVLGTAALAAITYVVYNRWSAAAANKTTK